MTDQASTPTSKSDRGLLLIFSQVFIPDPASVGQHIADVAIEMVRRGYRVRIYTASRGYDDPTQKYPKRENISGVDVRRLPLSSFGKKSIATRIIGTASFMFQAMMIALFTPGVKGIFFSTSPPMIGIVPSMARMIRRYPIAYWAMDLNPDQLIQLKKISPRGFIAWALERANRFILRSASLVIALDRFMAERLQARVNLEGRMIVLPPWFHEHVEQPLDHSANPFRTKHGLNGKFVVMYSGNHSPSNPLSTLLKAMVELKDEQQLHFMFVGGGIGKREVEETVRQHQLTNATLLPYQPLSELRYSLSAADVHVVALGDGMVGIIHPCKIYGSMAVARPVLYFGPAPSHISDLLEKYPFGRHVAHGDVSGAVSAIRELHATHPERLGEMGTMAQRLLNDSLGQIILNRRLCDNLEAMLQRRPLPG